MNKLKKLNQEDYETIHRDSPTYVQEKQENEFENESGILFAVKVLAILTFLGVLSFAGSSIANFILNNF